MTTAPAATSPLAGITVLALEQAIAAPLCTRHLADLGARVIKVEQPGTGDASRHYDGVVRGLAAHFVWLNHGKQSGRGAVIPVAMLDVAAEMMGSSLNQVLHGGGEPQPVGMGSPIVAPYGAYPTADGQTAVLGTTSDREWRRLTKDLLERPDLAEDPRYARNE